MRTKEEFLRRFGADYGYPDAPKGVDEIRATEFKRLEGLVYLDHAGATLYSEAQMEAVAKDLTSNVYGNPHSQSDSSMATSDIVSAARQQVLDYLNGSPKDYSCIFTSGATAALKLVGECFPWSRESCYMYTMENHNSVLGIREYALEHGAAAIAVDVNAKRHDAQDGNYESPFLFSEHPEQRREAKLSKDGPNSELSESTYHLFAFPSECNFSGQKFSLDLVNIVKKDAGKFLKGWQHPRNRCLVLVDGAKGCATEPPDLSRFPADFVVFSFYKIFGYPTGLGALVVRREAARILTRTYFSGGTVSASIADVDFVKRRDVIEQVYEDGTLSFLAIASIHHGFKIIDTLTVSAIARHTRSLAAHVRSIMKELKHENGMEFCRIYGTDFFQAPFGPTISFNLRRSDGSWIGYREVERLASLSGIQLRTGCFCNPGACAKYLGLSHSDLIANFEAGHVCWDDNDILHGNPTGAVRISFGYMSTYEDAEICLKFLETSFIMNSGDRYSSTRKSVTLSGNGLEHFVKKVRVKSITLYPVKSCAGFTVNSWLLSSTGLKYDREWLLQGPTGEILTQKKVPKMRCIFTFIDLENAMLHLESPFCKERLEISILQNSSFDGSENISLYGQRYNVQSYNDQVNLWFSEAVGRPCTLVRCSTSQNLSPTKTVCIGEMCRDTMSKLNFVNEAQLLLVSEESVSDLNNRLNSRLAIDKSGSTGPLKVDAARFRPNLVISGSEAFAEDRWRSIHIGEAQFTSLGGCSRCQMINLDQQSGLMQKSKEPLATLASYRRVKGKILFGILLKYEIEAAKDEKGSVMEQWLHAGQELYPYSG